MAVTCESCLIEFEPKSTTARFCSARCRKRAQRRREREDVAPLSTQGSGSAGSPSVTVPAGSLTESTVRVLEEAGKVDTPAGRAALLLARRLDMQTADTGSSIAALVREHAARLAAATRNAKAGDEVDELKERRDRKRAHSG